MKRILAPILLLVFLFPSLALSEDIAILDLEFRDGRWYQKSSDIPFSGKVTTGSERGSFKKGKRDGPWVWYHVDGQLGGKGTYKDGELEGPWVYYYDNGQLWKKETYKDGKKISD